MRRGIAVEFVLVALACAALVTAKHYRELVYWLCLVVFAILHVAIFMRIGIPVVFDAPVFSWLPLVVADIAVMMWSIEWMVGRFRSAGLIERLIAWIQQLMGTMDKDTPHASVSAPTRSGNDRSDPRAPAFARARK
jgi:hypothetical protein